MKNTTDVFFGEVTESLPNLEFRIALDNGKECRAYTAGKMKLNKIKVLIGDRVQVVLPPGSAIGRVVSRLKMKV